MSNSFNSIKDLGSSVQANISYGIGIFDFSFDNLIIRISEMFIIYFNSVIQIAINKRLNNSLEFRGVLASFILGILLLFPSIRVTFTSYVQSRSGIQIPQFVCIIYNLTGSYIFTKFSNIFSFSHPHVCPTKLILTFLKVIKSYIGNPQLVSNFILGNRYLHDTVMLIDVLSEILLDKSYSWLRPELLFDILVDSPVFLIDQLGLKSSTITGSSVTTNFGVYAMTFFEGIIFYKSDIDSELYFYLFCIVFQVRSTVCIKLSYVLRCLSP